MLFTGDKKDLATIIMKKMKGHGDMSPSFESENETMEKATRVDGAEQDYSSAHEKCCNDMMSAMKSGDSKQFQSSIKSLISMMLEEHNNSSED